MERAATLDELGELAQVVLGGPGIRSGLLSRFSLERTSLGGTLVLNDKITGDQTRLLIGGLDQEMLESGCGFVEAIEHKLMAVRCIACWNTLPVDGFALCGSCTDERVRGVLVVKGQLAE